MPSLLGHLLTSDPRPPELQLRPWWAEVGAVRESFAHPLERALALGLIAPSVGSALIAGYSTALQALVPSLGIHTRAALCATEQGRVHPRTISTLATPNDHGLTLDGTKRFVTGGVDAELLLVLASEGPRDASGDNILSLLRVSPKAQGVAFEPLPSVGIVPDVSHSQIVFSKVQLPLDARLPGEGWRDYVKPFRTLEDLHVQAAITAFLLGTLRRHAGPQTMCERLLAQALTLRALSDASVQSPVTHLALAGSFAGFEAMIKDLDPWWLTVNVPERESWMRDRAILTVASYPREQRRLRAWESVGRTEPQT